MDKRDGKQASYLLFRLIFFWVSQIICGSTTKNICEVVVQRSTAVLTAEIFNFSEQWQMQGNSFS